MAQRVIIGTRSSEVGFWVSKPGKSATSANPADYLVDTTHENLRPIRNGVIINPILSQDSSTSSPSKTYSGFWHVEPKDEAGHTLENYSGDWYLNEDSYVADGFALYTKRYYYNSNHSSLGYRPLVHISIGSDTAGDAYPRVYVDDIGITLSHRELWQGSRQRASQLVTTYYPKSFYSDYFKKWYWDGTYKEKGSNRQYWYQNAPKNSSFQTNCTIHYTVYERAW